MNMKIRHIVIFNLKYPKGSSEAQAFIIHAKSVLEDIPYADEFMQCLEISPKNKYDYGFAFDFSSKKNYDKYNNHPDHINFVQQCWNNEVTDFMEIDLEEMQ